MTESWVEALERIEQFGFKDAPSYPRDQAHLALPQARAAARVVEAAELLIDDGRGTTWFEHGMDLAMSHIIHGPGKECDCPSPKATLRAALSDYRQLAEPTIPEE